MLAKLESIYTGSGDQGSTMFAFNMEQGLPVLPEWLCFNRVTGRARKGIHIGPARFLFSLSGGHVVGKFSPHEAFVIGGTNSVRGYEEGAVGSGRSYVVGSGELSFPVVGFSLNIPKISFHNGVKIMTLILTLLCREDRSKASFLQIMALIWDQDPPSQVILRGQD
jgi:hypothetical protein